MNLDKLMIVMFIILGVHNSSAQDLKTREVPSLVLNKFQLKFPKANEVEWERKHEYYKAEFELGTWSKRDYDAYFTDDGRLAYYQYDITIKELPNTIVRKLLHKYPEASLSDAKKIISWKKENYKVEVKTTNGERNVWLDANANIVKESLD